jgi:hypothetical protein
MKKELVYVPVSAEWGDTSGLLDNLKIALKHLDIHVTDDPRYEGDLLGIIVSNRKITKKELKTIGEEE